MQLSLKYRTALKVLLQSDKVGAIFMAHGRSSVVGSASTQRMHACAPVCTLLFEFLRISGKERPVECQCLCCLGGFFFLRLHGPLDAVPCCGKSSGAKKPFSLYRCSFCSTSGQQIWIRCGPHVCVFVHVFQRELERQRYYSWF